MVGRARNTVCLQIMNVLWRRSQRTGFKRYTLMFLSDCQRNLCRARRLLGFVFRFTASTLGASCLRIGSYLRLGSLF